MLFTDLSGAILANSDGTIIDDETCCCEESGSGSGSGGGGACPDCYLCDSGYTPESLLLTFLADPSNIGEGMSGCGDSGNCEALVGAYELPQLTQSQVDYLYAHWPSTWPQPSADPASDEGRAGCYYGMFEGLPCSMTAIVARFFLNTGGTGFYLQVIAVWADGVYAGFVFPIGSQPANCNGFDIDPIVLGEVGYSTWFSFSNPPPCNFENVWGNASLTVTPC